MGSTLRWFTCSFLKLFEVINSNWLASIDNATFRLGWGQFLAEVGLECQSIYSYNGFVMHCRLAAISNLWETKLIPAILVSPSRRLSIVTITFALHANWQINRICLAIAIAAFLRTFYGDSCVHFMVISL